MIGGDGSPEADAAAEDEGLATAGGGKTAEPAPEPTAGGDEGPATADGGKTATPGPEPAAGDESPATADGGKAAASESAGQAPRQGELF